jgi:Glycosyltransferase family 87
VGAGLIVAPLAILVAFVAIEPGRDLRIAGFDLGVYADYGSRLLAGSIPYRGFALEYPPLGLVPMSLPLLVWPFGAESFDTYAWLFTIAEGCLAVAVAWTLGAISDRPLAARATWLTLVFISGASIAWRYDLWPAALVLAALVATERGRPGLAGMAIGIGALMKIFPIVVLPVLALRAIAMRDLAGLGRLIAGCVAIVGVVLALTFAVAGGHALDWLTYQLDRGLQLESVGSGLLLLLHVVNGHPIAIDHSFGTLQVVSPGSDLLVAATPFVELLAVVAVWGATAVRFRLDTEREGRVPTASLVAGTTAVIVAVLVTSKVFSVQYVVWFMPLVPLLPPGQRWLSLAIAAFSAVIFPLLYAPLWQLEPAMTIVLDVRNGLLVILLGWLVAGLLARARAARTGDARRAAVPTA